MLAGDAQQFGTAGSHLFREHDGTRRFAQGSLEPAFDGVREKVCAGRVARCIARLEVLDRAFWNHADGIKDLSRHIGKRSIARPSGSESGAASAGKCESRSPMHI